MHFRIRCATILVIFCPLKRLRITHNQLSARVDSQINFSVVVHGRMQDLPREANYFFLGGGQLSTRGVAMRLLGGFGACFPEKNFLNGAIWCVLEHISINSLLSKSLKISFLVVFFFSKKLPIVVVRDVCPSVRPSVRLSVRPSVCPSVRPSVVCGNNFFSR